MLDLIAAGAPIDQLILDPYFAQANKLMLARHAPHPHAAALFYDWALSEEGQSMITTFGRVVARKNVKQRFPELVQKEYFLVDVDFIGPIMDNIGKEFGQIFWADERCDATTRARRPWQGVCMILYKPRLLRRGLYKI